MAEQPEHLRAETADRGFDHLPPIPGAYGGSVRVYESSAARSPHIWLSVDIAEAMHLSIAMHDSAPVHLTVEDARRLAEQILWLCDNHYQTANTTQER